MSTQREFRPSACMCILIYTRGETKAKKEIVHVHLKQEAIVGARMCVSNKIPANYYYNDAFLEANWPPAKFIHLANVPYSVWLVYVYTGAPRRCMSLSLHIAPRTLLWLLGIGQEPRELSVLHRWPPFTQFIIMLRQINPWEYYCSFAAPVFCTLWRFICCSRAKLPGYLFLRRKRAGICANSEQIPDKSMFAFARLFMSLAMIYSGSEIRQENPSNKGSKAISSFK
jgi:hypothetical protein